MSFAPSNACGDAVQVAAKRGAPFAARPPGATQAASCAAAAALKRERGYFSSNTTRVHYPSFRQQQLPIGSGAVEASTAHLV